MAANRKVQFDHGRGPAKRRGYIAVALSADRRFGRQNACKLARGNRCVDHNAKVVDLHTDQICRVFSHIWIGCKHGRHGFTNVANAVLGQHRLPERGELFVRPLTEIYG